MGTLVETETVLPGIYGGSDMSKNNSALSLEKRKLSGAKTFVRWKISYMNAYMTYYAVAHPKKTSGLPSKNIKRK
jgi:hypothetical protein